ncbi:MAG TPA: redox-sensing transcriptional repressor Rex [Syntrophorhabdaceae bacterium]|nr:redox-sensing transcriptional repressor Rex [Syntrophorhabdaceae bacterium]
MTNMEDKNDLPTKPIPEPTLRRLPVYYQYLKKIKDEKKGDFISCTQIGNDLSILPIQVRKDLEVTEAVGKPKLGYGIEELITVIGDFLGWNNTKDAYLVGVGHLGTALLGFERFREHGLNIIAAFDIDAEKIGQTVHGVRVFHIKKLPDMVKRMGIKIGILTTPAYSAQDLTDNMVKAGIKAIWNFSPEKVNVPPGIIVQHENLAASLVVLSKKLALTLKAQLKDEVNDGNNEKI